MNDSTNGFRIVAALRAALGARAAGLWKVEPAGLAQVAFVPAPDLDPDVARGFAEATRWIGREHRELGVVQACTAAEVVVSRAAELPPEIGSGRWLRAFGAARSVAMPLVNPRGQVVGILSVAIGEGADDDRVAESIRAAGAPWDGNGPGHDPASG